MVWCKRKTRERLEWLFESKPTVTVIGRSLGEQEVWEAVKHVLCDGYRRMEH